VAMMIKLIMQRVFATIAIISTVVPKNHGTVLMKNFMQEACVKTATSTCITKKREKSIRAKHQMIKKWKMSIMAIMTS
jgi:hypothetical protein